MVTWTQLPLVSGLSYLICVIFKFECTIVQQMKCANYYLLLLRTVVKKQIFYGQADCKGEWAAPSAWKCENFDLLKIH